MLIRLCLIHCYIEVIYAPLHNNSDLLYSIKICIEKSTYWSNPVLISNKTAFHLCEVFKHISIQHSAVAEFVKPSTLWCLSGFGELKNSFLSLRWCCCSSSHGWSQTRNHTITRTGFASFSHHLFNNPAHIIVYCTVLDEWSQQQTELSTFPRRADEWCISAPSEVDSSAIYSLRDANGCDWLWAAGAWGHLVGI